jgi:hypothetical protein
MNIVWASSPTGVTEEEKIAMAVTIHCNFTKKWITTTRTLMSKVVPYAGRTSVKLEQKVS